MSTFVLELGCEEIPARFMTELLAALATEMQTFLTEQSLSYGRVSSMGTYRRLVVSVIDLQDQQDDRTKVIKGPPLAIGQSESGAFLPPAIGFAKRVGVDVSDLEVDETGPKPVLVAKQFVKGRRSQEILAQGLADLVQRLPLRIQMRWSDSESIFVRPLHWVLALLDEHVLPVSILGVQADRFTYSHRFLGPESASIQGASISVPEASQLPSLLAKASVVLDPSDREQRVRIALSEHQQEDINDALVTEVVFLTESPTPLLGQFDTAFLSVPEPVLVACMTQHQKYFPIYENTQLTNRFLVVADNVTDQNQATILKGNERVLAARLADAQFFWEQDLKRPLASLLPQLSQVIYQQNLGSMADKQQRLTQLALGLARDLGLETDPALIQRAGGLCKADLVSLMVGEFGGLQGVMGSLYARHHGEDDQVSEAIQAHYRPQSQSDQVPDSEIGVLLGLADRADSVVASFYKGLIPTGSKDPMGVRRAIFGILMICWDRGYDFDLIAFLDQAYAQFGDQAHHRDELLSFLRQRVRGSLIETGLDYDVVDAVLMSQDSVLNVVAVKRSAQALAMFRQTQAEAFKAVTDTAVRVKRLAKTKVAQQSVTETLFSDEAERQAWQAFQLYIKSQDQVSNDQARLEGLLPLTTALVTYFDDVLVMAKDDKVRDNRLAFLAQVSALYHQVADFEKVVI